MSISVAAGGRSGEEKPSAHRPSTLLLKGDVPEVHSDQQAAIKKQKKNTSPHDFPRHKGNGRQMLANTAAAAAAAAAKPNLEAKHSRDRK